MILYKFIFKLLKCIRFYLGRKLFKSSKDEFCRVSSKRVFLSLVHVDPVSSLGGVQRYLFEDAKLLRNAGFDSIHIYPVRRCMYNSYSVNINNVLVARYLTSAALSQLLRSLLLDKVVYISIHHLLGWEKNDVKSVLSFSPHHFLFVHDTLFLDPNKFLMDISYKGIKNTSVFSVDFIEYILKSATNVVFPSNYLQEKFFSENSVFSNYSKKCKVASNLASAAQKKSKLRLAFLGYPAKHKGWDVFQALRSNANILVNYDLYHIGASSSKTTDIVEVSSDYKQESMKAESLLRSLDIDMVLLWSTVQESYSYTMYEAGFAGALVLTNTISGNIQHEVSNGKIRGQVFNDYDSLLSFLLDSDNLSKYLLRDNEVQQVLLHNSFVYNTIKGHI